MSDFHLEMWIRRLTNLAVAMVPIGVVFAVLAATPGLDPRVRMWCGASAGIITGLGMWAGKNRQSAADLQAAPLRDYLPKE